VGARAPQADLEESVDLDGRAAVVGVQRYQDGRDPGVPQHTDH